MLRMLNNARYEEDKIDVSVMLTYKLESWVERGNYHLYLGTDVIDGVTYEAYIEPRRGTIGRYSYSILNCSVNKVVGDQHVSMINTNGVTLSKLAGGIRNKLYEKSMYRYHDAVVFIAGESERCQRVVAELVTCGPMVMSGMGHPLSQFGLFELGDGRVATIAMTRELQREGDDAITELLRNLKRIRLPEAIVNQVTE